MTKSTLAAAITHQLESRCRPEGKSSRPAWVRSPSVATVAYTLRPAAKLTATINPASSEPPNFMSASISRLRFLHPAKKERVACGDPPCRTSSKTWFENLDRNPLPCSYKVDSISKLHASSNGSGVDVDVLFRRAPSRARGVRRYWSGESLYSCTPCSNSVIVGVTGPIASGLPQLGFTRRLAMKNMPSYAWNKESFFKPLSSLIARSAQGIHP